ncbi:MAG: carbonic anhydrase, partial [Nitrospiraceae bacterium]|nr:carbonic anhydrase [Nitrospiraceae bacterium]
MTQSRLLTFSLSLNALVAGIVLIGWVAPNVKTTFNPEVDVPVIAKTARIHPLGAVSGSTVIGEHVFVAPGASVRGDEGE